MQELAESEFEPRQTSCRAYALNCFVVGFLLIHKMGGIGKTGWERPVQERINHG